MRRILLILLVVAVVLIVAVGVIPSLVDVNHYHDRIQADLEKRFDRKVLLGKMRLSVVPLTFRVSDVVIGEDPRFNTGRPFAQAQELDVSPQVWPLLRGDIQINSLDMRQPQIELARSREGMWNFASFGQTSSPTKTREFSLSELKIENGQVAVTDWQKGPLRAVYDHIDLKVSGYAPARPFNIMAAAHLPGEGTQTMAIDARLGPVDQAHLVATPFDGKLRLDQVSLSSLQKFLNSGPLANTNAVASGEAHIKNEHAKLVSSGSLTLDHARINGVDIGYPISAQYDFSDDLDNDVLMIHKGALKLGSTPFSVTGTMNMKSTPAQLDVKVNTSNASIEETARLLAAFGVTFNPGMKIDGGLTADLQAQGAANRPALNGTLAAHDLEISGKDLREPVKAKSIQLALSPQEIRSNSFSASTGGTRVDAQFAISGYTTPSPDIDLTMHTGEAKVGELLNIARAYGVSAAEGMSGTGTVNLDLHATGPLKNSAAMNFSGSGLLRNASLHLPQLTKLLDVHNANLRFTQNSVVLENLAATLGQTNTNGTLTLRNFSAPQVQFTLTADKMNVAELEQMFSSGPAHRASGDQRWSLITSARAAAPNGSLLSKATGSGKISIGSVVYDQLLLDNAHSDVTLNRGIIRLAPLTADLYGGQESGAITIDTRPTPMVYTVSSGLKNVDANKLLSSISSVKGLIFGALMANANTTFRAAPSDQMARSLNGTLSLDLRNGRIAGVNLLQELAALGQFLNNASPTKPFTDVVQLTGKFNVRDGVARTDDLKAIIDAGTLAATGAVNLVDQSLDMHLTAVLSKEISEKVGGNGIGGFMNTALANNRGELVMPVIVTGTLQHPRFAPDAQKIAEMKFRNILPSSKNPNTVDNILGSIFGKPKNDQKQKPFPWPK